MDGILSPVSSPCVHGGTDAKGRRYMDAEQQPLRTWRNSLAALACQRCVYPLLPALTVGDALVLQSQAVDGVAELLRERALRGRAADVRELVRRLRA
jgi:hypothetical protein